MYFTEPDRYIQWMGSDAKLDPVPSGEYRLLMPTVRGGGLVPRR